MEELLMKWDIKVDNLSTLDALKKSELKKIIRAITKIKPLIQDQ